MSTTRICEGHYREITSAGIFEIERIGGTWFTSVPGRREGFHASTFREIKRVIGCWTLYSWSHDYRGTDGAEYLASIYAH